MSAIIFSVAKLSSEPDAIARGTEDIVPAKLGLWPPEWLVRFAERLLLRHADILQEVIVVGDITQRDPLARTREPAGNYAAAATYPADGTFLACAANGPSGPKRSAKG